MIRFLGFILRLALIAAIAIWLADRPGTARIVWHDYVIETSAAFLGLCGLILSLFFYWLFRVWHLMKHGPQQWRLHRNLKKLHHGQDQLTAGLVAIAGGNASEAGRLALQARKALGTTTATQLLQAQAAQLAGDHHTAKAIFQALASQNSSAILGYRGLIMEARRDQDWGEVAHLVEKLRGIKPDTPWLNLIRFELLTRQQDWEKAGVALTQASNARLIDPKLVHTYRAAVLVAASQNEAKQGNTDKALQAAEQAAKQIPGWLPAIINLTQSQMKAGHNRASFRTIEKWWGRTPHPQLAAMYRADNSNVMDAYKKTERLCHANEDAAVSHLVLAEAALAADVWGEARRHLIALISHNQATQSVYRMMAKLERRSNGDEQAAMQWLIKAGEVAPDPVWLCHSCGGAHLEWQATCKYCHHFNSLDWQSPGQSRTTTQQPFLLGNDWID